MGRDNSLTLVALKNIFEEKGVSMSLSTVNRAVVASGLQEKGLRNVLMLY